MNIKINYNLLLKLLIISFPFLALGINIGSETLTLSYLMFILLFLFYLSRNKFSIFLLIEESIEIYLFFAVAVMSVYISLTYYNISGLTIGDTPVSKDFKQLIMFAFMILQFTFLREIFKKQSIKEIDILITIFINVCIYISVYSIYQFIALKYNLPFKDILRNSKSYSMAKAGETSGWLGGDMFRTRAFMPESSFWGAFLLLPISLILPRVFDKPTLKLLSIILLFLLAEFLSFSRTGWAGLFVITCIFFLDKVTIEKIYFRIINMLLLAALVVLVISSIILPNISDALTSAKDYSFIVRYQAQAMSFKAFTDYPYTGIGWGNTGFVTNSITAYNFYLQLLLETGVFGFSLFMLFLFSIYGKLSRSYLLVINKKLDKTHRHAIIGIKLSFIAIIIFWINSSAYNPSYIWFILALSSAFPFILSNSEGSL